MTSQVRRSVGRCPCELTSSTFQANYLNSGRLLTDEQLRRLTELLNKMFVDAHTKVFSLLLDAVCELLLVHWQQLKDWLYQLMFRWVLTECYQCRER